MSAPRNEHEDFAAYEAGGIDAVMGIPRDRAMSLAKVLSIQAGRMDQRHPSTEIVKRDVSKIYELLHPEVQEAPEYQRSEARQTIANLKTHPAYMDAKHPEHARVVAQVTRAYEVENRGKKA